MHRIGCLVAIVMAAVLLSGCAERTHTDKTLVEWSRGKQLGFTSSNEPPAIAIAPSGDRIALAWPVRSDSGKDALYLVVLDGHGTVLTSRQLLLASSEPTNLRMVLAQDDALHLAWIDRSEGTPSLRHARVSLDGKTVGTEQRISPLDFRANGLDTALLSSGELLVVWSNREGLVATRISQAGTVQGSASLESADSLGLDLQVDERGGAHITWQQRPALAEARLWYVTLESSDLAFSRPIDLGAVKLKAASSVGGSATELLGPVISLDPERVILSWSISEVRGRNDTAYYVNLPRSGQLARVRGTEPVATAHLLALPPSYQPGYQPAQGSLPYQQLAPGLPMGAEAGRAYVRSAPSLVSSGASETPLGVSIWVRTAWSLQLQPAMAVLEGGTLKGFQVIGWSRYPSLHPNLAADAQNDLYVTWVDAVGKAFPVYLATTAPALRAELDEATGQDLRIAGERVLGRLVSAMGLLLFALSWLILPGFFLIFALFAVREDSLDSARGKSVLFLLIGLHWAGKYLFTFDRLAELPRLSDMPLIFPLSTLLMPHTMAYLPNELQLPSLLAAIVPYLLPSLTLIAGAILTRVLYLDRSRYPSLIPAYAILAAVDVFVSLQIYALAYFDPIRF